MALEPTSIVGAVPTTVTVVLAPAVSGSSSTLRRSVRSAATSMPGAGEGTVGLLLEAQGVRARWQLRDAVETGGVGHHHLLALERGEVAVTTTSATGAWVAVSTTFPVSTEVAALRQHH